MPIVHLVQMVDTHGEHGDHGTIDSGGKVVDLMNLDSNDINTLLQDPMQTPIGGGPGTGGDTINNNDNEYKIDENENEHETDDNDDLYTYDVEGHVGENVTGGGGGEHTNSQGYHV